MYIRIILIFLSLQQYTVYGAIKTSVSNTTVGSTQYIVKKTMFKKYPNLMPASTANNYQSINQEITNATTKKCGTFCYQENDCWSFLFFRSKTPPTCTLLDGPIDRTHMDQNTTVDYYEVWNQCSSNDSICNLGVCVPNYVTDSYTCHCPSTYTGQHCQTLISIPEYKCTENPKVIGSYQAGTTSWKIEVELTFKVIVSHGTFFEIQYNNQQHKLFALQLRTAYNKLVITDFTANIDGTARSNIQATNSNRYSPAPDTFSKLLFTFVPSLDQELKSSLHYELKDGEGETLGTGTIDIDIYGSLGEITLHNGSDYDAEKGKNHEESGFGAKIWTRGIKAA
eukprot:TCONS_00024855-protein